MTWQTKPPVRDFDDLNEGILTFFGRVGIFLLGLVELAFSLIIALYTYKQLPLKLHESHTAQIFAIAGYCAGLFTVYWGISNIIKALGLGLPSATSGLHGKAREATLKDAIKGGIFRRATTLATRDEGIYLGQFLDGKKAKGQIRYRGERHLITIGPPGSNKSAGLVTPNVSELPRSMIIIDPKGEIAAMTARKRATMGRVVIINPFNEMVEDRPYLKSDGYNPLASLDREGPRGDYFVEDARAIAEAIIKNENETQPFFANAARDLVTALIMWTRITRGPTGSLTHVRQALTEVTHRDPVTKQPIKGFVKTLFDMAGSDFEPIRNKVGPIYQLVAAGKESNSLQSVLSAANNGLNFMDSLAIGRDLQGDGFDFATMRKEVTTVYVIIPTGELISQAAWLRLIITSALRALMTTPIRGQARKRASVLFILDEFAQLGRLEPIEAALGAARSYGIQLWPFLQDLNQLVHNYPDKWETFLTGSGAMTGFAPKDLFTSEHLSKLSGQMSQFVANWSTNKDAEGRRGKGAGGHEDGFPVFMPDELRRFPPAHQLAFVEPVPHPMRTFAPIYLHTAFAEGLDSNPFHED